MKKKIGIALGGGFLRAAAHIGVLQVFKEERIPISFISGCSSGAIVAAAYASGTLEKLTETILNLRRRDILNFIDFCATGEGLLEGMKFRVFLDQFTKGQRFEDLAVKLFLPVSDVYTGEEIIQESGDLTTAIQASIAVPGLFKPKRIKDHLLVDGGLINLIPVQVLKDRGADFVIGVNVSGGKSFLSRTGVKLRHKIIRALKNYNLEEKIENMRIRSEKRLAFVLGMAGFLRDSLFLKRACRHPLNLVEISFLCYEIATRITSNADFINPPCDFLIQPDVLGKNKFSPKEMKNFIVQGYISAKESLPKIYKLLEK